MKLVPYTNEDSMALLKMMEKHIDFTPEIETSENEKANYDYVHEMCIDKQNGALSYLLKSDDGDILGYLSVCKHNGNQQWIYMRITSLFIKENRNSNCLAGTMFEFFTRLLQETKAICVNIHPSAIDAIDFWSNMGFIHTPELSSYTNIHEQRLVAYYRAI